MGLSSEEQKMLKKLQRKAEEPDTPAAGRNLNISIDLGDDKQVQRAQKLGLLDALRDDDDDSGDGDDDDDDQEDVPVRRSYFKDK